MAGDGIIVPILENVRIRRAAVLVRDGVHGFVVVIVDGPGDAITCKASVNFVGSDFNLLGKMDKNCNFNRVKVEKWQF